MAPPKPRTPTRAVKHPSRHGNRSVVVGLSLLKALATIGAPATLSEVARAAGLPRSRAHRFLSGLIDADAVRQEPGSGKYELGTMIIEIGVAALGSLDSMKLGAEALKEVTHRTGLASVLAVWGSNGPTVIRWEHGGLAAVIRIQEGGVLPLLTTACGKVFLAHMPEEHTAPLVENELRLLASNNRIAVRTQSDVKKLRQQVLRHGLGRAVAEENPGLTALAAPVFGASNRLTMAISVVSVLGVADMAFDGIPAQQLNEVAVELSRKLGAHI
jgi:DNA-binding IclR family transcriptional regulator